MIIAVDTGLSRKNETDFLENFYGQLFIRMAAAHPEHRFVFFTTHLLHSPFTLSPNIQVEKIPPPAGRFFLGGYRYAAKLQARIKKNKPDVYVAAGKGFLVKNKLPLCLLVQEKMLKKRNPERQLNAASLLIVSSAVTQQKINELMKAAHKTVLLYPAASDIYKPIDAEKKKEVKEKYCEGREYFFCRASHNEATFINLLKAFSYFKKRQQSGMKLLIAAGSFAGKENFTPLLATYKYRDDVVLRYDLTEEETAPVTAAAYAAVIVLPGEEAIIAALEAMQSAVPVIIAENAFAKELTGDVALYADINNPKDTADKLMQLYTNENLHAQMAQAGIQIAAAHTYEKAAEFLLQSIAGTVP